MLTEFKFVCLPGNMVFNDVYHDSLSMIMIIFLVPTPSRRKRPEQLHPVAEASSTGRSFQSDTNDRLRHSNDSSTSQKPRQTVRVPRMNLIALTDTE